MEFTAPKEKVTWEKRPTTAPELGTYTLYRGVSAMEFQRHLRPVPRGWYCVQYVQHTEIEAAFHIRLADSCNMLGTAKPATITSHTVPASRRSSG